MSFFQTPYEWIEALKRKYNVNRYPIGESTMIKDDLRQNEVIISLDKPQPKKLDYSEEYLSPKKLQDLPDDLIMYISSFLDVKELLSLSKVSKKLNLLTTEDSLWEELYKKTIWTTQIVKDATSEYKKEFLISSKNEFLLKKEKLSLQSQLRRVDDISTCCKAFYGFILPILFCLGLFTSFICFGLLLDDVIPNTKKNYVIIFSIFFVFCILVHLAIATGVLFDPTLLYYLRIHFYQRYFKNSITSIQTYPIIYDNSLVLFINLFVWGSLWLTLSIGSIFIKLALFADNQDIPYSIFPIPSYLLTVFLIIFPLIIIILCNIFSNMNLFSFSVWFTVVFINIITNIQILLITLKLDAILSTYWNIIFIPTWILIISICLCSIPFCVCAGLSIIRSIYNFTLFLLLILFGSCLMIPIIIFVLLLALRLEKVILGYYSLLFIPIYCLQCCLIFCLSACVFKRRKIFWEEDS